MNGRRAARRSWPWRLRPAAALPIAAACTLYACTGDDPHEQTEPMPESAVEPTAGMQAPAPTAAPSMQAEPVSPARRPPIDLSVCVNGQVRPLVPGMTLVRDVDYLADFEDGVLSERGIACSGAADPDECVAALSTAQIGSRRLVSTEGDDVRVWLPEQPLGLLGEIDVIEEALWIADTHGVAVGCNAVVTYDERGFHIDLGNLDTFLGCVPVKMFSQLRVGPDGEFESVNSHVPARSGAGEGGGGAAGGVPAGAAGAPAPGGLDCALPTGG